MSVESDPLLVNSLRQYDDKNEVQQPVPSLRESTHPHLLKSSDLGIAEHRTEARMRFSVFNLANTIAGGGILALPYAFMVRFT